MFIPIKVNGRGLIPRGHGLAPKSYVKADLQLIQLILGTPGLSMDFIQEDTNTLIPLNRNNYLEIYERFVSQQSAVPVPEKKETGMLFPPLKNPITATNEMTQTAPTSNPTTPVVEPTKAPEPVQRPEPVVKEEVKENTESKSNPEEKKEDFSFKPVHKEHDKKKN